MEDAGGNVKQVYGLVKYLLGNEVESKYPVVNSDENLAEKFAGFFDDKIYRIYDQFSNNQSIDLVDFANVGKQIVKLDSFEHVPIEEIQSTVMSMHSKSCSLDVIPTWLLKKVLNSLLPILHFIVNSSLRESYVPPSLKQSIITPVLKKSNLNANTYKSFRPVSNLSFISKLIEKCVYYQLVSYLNFHDLFGKFQSAYRIGHSCETALTRIHNDLLCGCCTDLDQTSLQTSLLVLLDLSAAFDTLNHHQLLFVLKNDYGLCDNVLKWFYSYLSSQTFSVVAAGSKSSVHDMCIGVPQGSILGPVLFILFTKGLEDVVHAHNLQFYSYADDSVLVFNVHPHHQCSAQSQLLQLQNYLSDVNNWMSNHFLKLNVDKTEVMEVSIYPNLLPKVFHNFSLLFDQNACLNFSTVKHVKNHGFVFDDSLNLVTSQINQIVKTCYHRLNN